MTTLGSWQHGILPGITTAEEIAADVHTDRLNIPLQHKKVNPDDIQLAFINSKGFGGNNATGWVLRGKQCRKILRTTVSDDLWSKYLSKNETIRNKQQAYLIAMAKENQPLPVKDKEMPPEPDDINLTEEGMTLPGWKHRILF
jgi:acetoacetyl-[acyl-carrier protein] synthase